MTATPPCFLEFPLFHVLFFRGGFFQAEKLKLVNYVYKLLQRLASDLLSLLSSFKKG
jgi:hypothetical protein